MFLTTLLKRIKGLQDNLGDVFDYLGVDHKILCAILGQVIVVLFLSSSSF